MQLLISQQRMHQLNHKASSNLGCQPTVNLSSFQVVRGGWSATADTHQYLQVPERKKKRKRLANSDEAVPAENGAKEVTDAADALPAPDSDERPAKKPSSRRAVQKAQAGFDQPLDSPETKVCHLPCHLISIILALHLGCSPPDRWETNALCRFQHPSSSPAAIHSENL